MRPRIGVYVCHCGTNIADTVQVEEVARFATTLPHVIVSRDYPYMCSDPAKQLIQDDIRTYHLNRVVVAACSPAMHESTFRRVCQEAGLNPYLFVHVNIRENCSWVHRGEREKATHKAKLLVLAGIRRAHYNQPLSVREVNIARSALVIGGGVAGIQSALEIAKGGYKVYLVESDPSIGGHMIQFYKTFPTLDCPQCVLTPKMSEVGAHPNIVLLAYSEVVEVSGYIGNFRVKIKQKPRYVEELKCNGCGKCAEVCPVSVPSEFDEQIGRHRAIFKPFAQAVPNVYTIRKENGSPCGSPCQSACPLNMNVPGYVRLCAEGRIEEAYRLIRKTNPLPSVCGRVCYAPCESACILREFGQPISCRRLKRFVTDVVNSNNFSQYLPEKNGKRVAIVGSGPAGLSAAHDLALMGYSVTVFERLPQVGGMLRYGIPEYRLPREVLEGDIQYIKKMGVEFRTGVEVGKDIDIEDILEEYNAVLLATGTWRSARPKISGIDLPGVWDGLDFLFKTNKGESIEIGGMVVVIGGGNVAIDAARVARRLGADPVIVVYRRSREDMRAYPEEVVAAEEEGVNFLFLASVTEIFPGKSGGLTLRCIRMEPGEMGQDGRRISKPVAGSDFFLECNAVIYAVGLESTPFPVQNSAEVRVDRATLSLSIPGIFVAGDVVTGPSTVVEAMSSGKRVAEIINNYLTGTATSSAHNPNRLSIQMEDRKRSAMDKLVTGEVSVTSRIHPQKLDLELRTSTFEEVEKTYTREEAVREANRCLCAGTVECIECGECLTVCPTGAIDHSQKEKLVEIQVGAIIVATGYDLLDASVIPQYGYKKYANVFTALELERLASNTGPTQGRIVTRDGRLPKSVGIIHCVGSRDENYRPYCSRVCCMYALKLAHYIRESTDAKVYQLYMDMRSFGQGYEEFYRKVSEEGVIFVRGKAAEVSEEGNGRLKISVMDTLLGKIVQLPVDMVILCPAIIPRKGSEVIARILNLSRREDGFFRERHIKLDPFSTSVDGVFIAGCCHSPKDISDTVSHASGAAARVLGLLSLGKIVVDVEPAQVDEEMCRGCGQCVAVCTFHAIEIDEKKKVARVNETLCKGCGHCSATCPSKAISHANWTPLQLFGMVGGLHVPTDVSLCRTIQF